MPDDTTQTPSELEQERQRLKAQIDELSATAQERDPDGTPSVPALQATKRLEKLQDDYRQILIALKPAASSTGTVNDVTRSDGSVWRIDAQGKPTQVLGPGGKPLGSNNVTTNTTDQYVVSVDQTDGHLITAANPNYVPPKPGQVSANTSDQYIVTMGPDGTLTPTKNPNYQPQPKQVQGNTTDQFIIQQMPDGSISTQKNPNYQPKTATVVGGTTGSDQQFIIKQNPDGTTSQIPNPNYVPKTPTTVSAGTDTPYIVRQKADGTTETIPNPNYQAKPSTVTTSENSPFIVQQKPDGSITQVPNPNYRKPKPTQLTTPADQSTISTMDENGNISSQANPSFQPKTQADIAARIGQIQSLAAAKQAEVQGKVGQNGYTADNALNDFNSWWAQNVEPQQQALSAAQEQVQFNRAKDIASMRTSAMTSAIAAGNQQTEAFNAMRQANPVGNMDAMRDMYNKATGGKFGDIVGAVTYQAPNPMEAAKQGTQDALKYIDPTMAQQAGLPAPNFQGMDIGAALGRNRYQFNPAAAAQVAGNAQGQQTNVDQNPALAAANQAGATGFNPQASTAALNAMGLQDTPYGRDAAAVAAGKPSQYTPGLFNPAWQQGSPGAAGMLAQGDVAGATELPAWLTGAAPPPPPAPPGMTPGLGTPAGPPAGPPPPGGPPATPPGMYNPWWQQQYQFGG